MMYLTGNRAEADDLAQNALVLILDSAGSYRGESALEHWACRVAVRNAIRQIRKARRRRELDEEISPPETPFRGAEEAADLAGLRQRLAKLLAKLSLKQRAVVVMFHVEGLSIPEIAEATGAPLNTVRHRLHVGRKKLWAAARKDRRVREWTEVQAT
jgi:RNA polymerase sigma-70 factor (ECF subfamily)